MSQAPAMPLLWGDYWSKTRRLTPTQHHAYLFLLGATWMNNCIPFPDDDDVIAGEIGLSVSAWRKVRPAIVRFFNLTNGTWRNPKLEEVWAEVMLRIAKNRENGKRGGRPRKGDSAGKPQQNQSSEKPDGFVSLNPNESIQNQREIEEEEESPDGDSTLDAQPASGASNARSGRTRGTRIAVDWEPEPGDCDFARSLGLDPAAVTPEFRDFWSDVPGAKGRKVSWSGTYRNRCRQIAERHGSGQAGRSGGTGSSHSRIAAALSRVSFATDVSGLH